MKTNLFKVRKIKEEKIEVEEEQLKKPLLLFFKRNWGIISLILGIIGVSTLGVSLGIIVTLFRDTEEFDITYTSGSEEITPTPLPDSKDAEKEIYGNIAITEGVVIEVKKFKTTSGDVVTYYSDGTSLILTSDGKYKRVVALENGDYAIDENGKIDENTIRKLVTASTETQDNGLKIVYFSDGSAEITKGKVTIFVRDSKNIKFQENKTEQLFDNVSPSGVSLQEENTKDKGKYKYTKFSDDTYLIESNGKKYIVHNNDDITLTENSYAFNNNNAFTVKDTKELDDGNTVEYFNDGSAIITNENNEMIFVRRSGDIVIKNNKTYEIVPNKIANAVSTIKTSDGMEITYYDNGAAVIKNTDGTKTYVEDSSLIKYDDNQNIKTVDSDKYNQTSQGKAKSGTNITKFENEKTQIIDTNGNDYIIDTTDVLYDAAGNIINEEMEQTTTTTTTTTKKASNSKKSKNTHSTTTTTTVPVSPGDLDMSDSDDYYNYSKSAESSTFTIRNKTNSPKGYMIVIEEIDDYSKYNIEPLSADYVYFRASVGAEPIEETVLGSNKVDLNNDKNDYCIYKGTLGAGEKKNVNIILYILYKELDNTFQDKTFKGTIKLYYYDETK